MLANKNGQGNKLITALLLGCISLASISAQAERDPFAPFTGGGGTASVSAAGPQALLADPMGTFRIIGVVISTKGSLALVQNRNRQNIKVHPGDTFGREGGTVVEIVRDGIKVKVGADITLLSVSNPVEATNDAKKSK